jgi:hypothetical protein
MANAVTFGNTYINAIRDVTTLMMNLRELQGRASLDATLATSYLTQNGRTDIVAADLVSAFNALNTLLAAYDAGNPPLKQALYKVLP